MVKIKATLPTKNLPIKRVMAKLFQSFVYRKLDDSEHEGYTHSNGKVFKAMNFKMHYHDNVIEIDYAALDKENEKKIAMAVLLEGLKLGEVHIVDTEVSLENRHDTHMCSIKVGGFVCAAIKDGKSRKKIYLEPKSHKFQEIVYNNTVQKYEALFGKSYEGKLTINVIRQKLHPRIFFYQKGVIKSWYGEYEIEADSDMLGMVLDTGIGAHAMQGMGFVKFVV